MDDVVVSGWLKLELLNV